MTDIPGVTGGVGGIDDAMSNAAAVALVITLSKAITVPCMDAPAIMAVDAFATTMTAANLRSPFPFFEASGKWEEVGSTLEEWEEETKNTLRSFDAAWDGPGADAFVEYVEGKLLPAVKELRDAAGVLKDNAQSNAEGLITLGWIPYAASVAITAIMAISSKALKPIPYVGEALYQAAIAVIAIEWILMHLTTTLLPLVMSIASEFQAAADLQAKYQELASAFESQAGNFDAGSLERDRREVASAMQDPSGWSKA